MCVLIFALLHSKSDVVICHLHFVSTNWWRLFPYFCIYALFQNTSTFILQYLWFLLTDFNILFTNSNSSARLKYIIYHLIIPVTTLPEKNLYCGWLYWQCAPYKCLYYYYYFLCIFTMKCTVFGHAIHTEEVLYGRCEFTWCAWNDRLCTKNVFEAFNTTGQ